MNSRNNGHMKYKCVKGMRKESRPFVYGLKVMSVEQWADSTPRITPIVLTKHTTPMRPVFSRRNKVRKTFTIDDKIIRQYVEYYGISIKEARQMYRLFVLRMQLNNPNLYA